jgi:hypothetical protein
MSNNDNDVTKQLLEQNAELIRMLKEKEEQEVDTRVIPPYKPTPQKNSFESFLDFVGWTFKFMIILIIVFYVLVVYM